MGCECSPNAGDRREDSFCITVAKNSPNDDTEHCCNHHHDRMWRVGLIAHHPDEDHWNKDATKPVHRQHNKAEHRVAESRELLANE